MHEQSPTLSHRTLIAGVAIKISNFLERGLRLSKKAKESSWHRAGIGRDKDEKSALLDVTTSWDGFERIGQGF